MIRSGTKTDRAKILPWLKKRVIELSEGFDKQNMPAHRWEIYVLKYATPLYGQCVHVFDLLRNILGN